VPIVLKSASLKLLEPSGPVQARNGIALPFFTFYLLHMQQSMSSRMYGVALREFSLERAKCLGFSFSRNFLPRVLLRDSKPVVVFDNCDRSDNLPC
jgi:hypothetical protein